MPSLIHDALVQLFRNRATLVPELLRDALHTPVPAFDHVRIGDASLAEVVPTEYRADLVLLLEGTTDGPPAAAVIVEAQLGRDPDKRWSWPVYLTSLRSVMLHGHGADAVAVAEAALSAAHALDDERAKLYADLVYASVHEAARAILEALMTSGTYEYQSDFARRYVAQGRAEGLARALLAVLAARGLDVPEDVRKRIASCADLERLDGWLARAVTAVSASDVVRE